MYLSGIRLAHIERGLSDPTESTSLHLVGRGIRCQQGDSRRVRLPITINLLCLLKEQLQTSTCYTPIEQRMLWALFTQAFYGLFITSELLSNLSWSDFTLSLNQMSITLRQSKTDPFRCGQIIHIFATGSSTCPIRAMTIYHNFISNKDSIDPVFHAGRFQPLTQKKLNEILRCLLQQGGINQADYASHSFRLPLLWAFQLG